MLNPIPFHIRHRQSAGFTLLELLVVISLLAVLAGLSFSAYDGVQDDAKYDATIYEMAEIRNALLQFRRDSGTNDFPGHGTYDCTDASNGGSATAVNTSFAPMPSEAGSTAADQISWCQHPANFWMLYENPLSTNWNPDTKRGWHGPYLRRKSGFVDIGAVQANGTGDPNAGAITTNLWGVSSPFTSAPNGNYLAWRNQVGANNLDNAGTPYFFFDLDDDGSDPTTTNPARLVSLGIGNAYDGDDTSDCSQTIANDGYPLDHILCLLR